MKRDEKHLSSGWGDFGAPTRYDPPKAVSCENIPARYGKLVR